MSEEVYLLDGHYLIYRSYHAMSQADLRDSSGQPTGAIYGVLRFLVTLIREYDPDYLLCAIDSEEPTFRHEFYEEYKIHRPEMPDDLRAQLPTIMELFDVLEIPVLQEEGFESDDLLASLVDEWQGADRKFVIVSNDKDNFQLVNGSVQILKQKKGLSETRLLSRPDVENELGVKPDQIPDYLSLVGDSVDNIPGVKGVGSTYASRLLDEFDSVEGMFDDPERMTEAVSERLAGTIMDNQDQIKDSKHLVQLRYDAPISVELEEAKFRGLNYSSLIDFCRNLNFRSIVEELETDLDYTPGWDDLDPDWTDLTTDDLDGLEVSQYNSVYLHLDRNHSSVMAAKTFFLVFCRSDEITILKDRFADVQTDVLRSLYESLAESDCWVFNQKRLQLAALRAGIEPAELLGSTDLRLVSYLIDPDKNHTLNAVLSRESGVSVPDYAEDWADRELFEWLARRSVLLNRIGDDLLDMLEDRNQHHVLEELERPLTHILAHMEYSGISLDQSKLEDLSEEIRSTIENLRTRAHQAVDRKFNLNSPKQLRKLLFEELNLPVQSKTDSGKPSTNAETLESLKDEHELPGIILDYRKYNKVESTYLSPLVETINPRTGKIHTEFNQTVAATGRLSSSNPNLQNIPVRDEFGRQVREAFVPSNDRRRLLAADYSQIELRLLAHMSRDESLMGAFREGKDVHTLAAADIFDKESAEVDESDRRVAKVVNYGIAYGLSAHGLSRDLDIPHEEAQNYIDRYFERYPGVRAYLDRIVDQAQEQGYVETLWGRRRYIPELQSDDFYQQQFAERAAVNAPIQGTAADLMKRAMIDLYPRLDPFDCDLLLQVHDELVLEAEKSCLEQILELVKDVMVEAINLRVPVTVSLKTGTTWGEVSK